jgi:serine protease Do
VTKGTQAVAQSDFFPFSNPGLPGGRQRGAAPPPTAQVIRGAGSGFIIDKSGYILTNNHVVEDADEITVMLDGVTDPEEGLAAKVVGRDTVTDTALIQLTETPKQPLQAVKFGDSSQIAAGDWVMAIGNPFQFANSVTVGVVSAVGRVSFDLNPVAGRDLEYIQTDAAINRGNSGGPLLNIRGEVVGMNTAILSDQTGYFIGIGFAVPINTVRDVLPQLRTGKVVRGRIGVFVSKLPMTLDEAKSFGLSAIAGAVVSSVEENGPAQAGGIKAGDLIVEFNGKPVKDSADLVAVVSATAPGTSAPVKVMRDAKPVTLTVKVAELNTEATQTAAVEERPQPTPTAPKDTGVGMTVEAVTPRAARTLPNGRGGAVVSDTDPDGAADRAGIAPGDVILQIDNRAMTSVDDVTKALAAVPPGQTAHVLVFRPNGNGTGGTENFLQLRKR